LNHGIQLAVITFGKLFLKVDFREPFDFKCYSNSTIGSAEFK